VQANDEEEAERLFWAGDVDTDDMQERTEAVTSSIKEWNGDDDQSERAIEVCGCHRPRRADLASSEPSL
jgi:hypothetical protein